MLASHNEKARSLRQRDTLTELGSHPTVFGQKISNPTPIRNASCHEVMDSAESPKTPANQSMNDSGAGAKSVRSPQGALNHSLLNIPSREPHPWHVKRGTISAKPVGAQSSTHKYTPPQILRQKHSAENLRNGSHAYNGSSDQHSRPGLGERSASGETIDVHLHQTPDQRTYHQLSNRDTWESTEDDDLSPIIQRGRLGDPDVSSHQRPNGQPLSLGAAYDASIYPPPLAPPVRAAVGPHPVAQQSKNASNRDTTWSGVINDFVDRR